MKKIINHLLPIFMLLIFFFSGEIKAQNTPIRHITYKGIPLTGSVTHFYNELERKEFTPLKEVTGEGTKIYHRGVFASFKSIVRTLSTPISNTVYGTITYIEEHTGWKEIFKDYSVFKDNLTAVYGKPSYVKEEFQAPYIRNDGYSMKALTEGKVNYTAEWWLDNGTIKIKIIQLHQGSGCVEIDYMDKENLNLKDKEQTTIIRNDL